jgi:hypothetical protein
VTASVELKWIPDERLAYRPNPNYPGHDARGWRASASSRRRTYCAGRIRRAPFGRRCGGEAPQPAAAMRLSPRFSLALDAPRLGIAEHNNVRARQC